MRTNYFQLALFIVLGLSMMRFHCGKYDITNPAYEFSEKISLTPYKKTYSINDTIWVQFQTTDKKLFDKLSNSRIATDTTFLTLNFHYHKRYPGNFSQGDKFCDIVVNNGINPILTNAFGYNTLQVDTDCGNTLYNVKIGFVPKTTGIYSIELFNPVVRTCPAKISAFPYSLFSLRFDLSDCNKDVFFSIPSASRGGETGFTDVKIDNKEIFVFKVE